MKWWLLFVFDLAVIVCILRAIYLTHAATKAQPTLGHEPYAAGSRNWLISEAGGWIVAGCICAFIAFIAAIHPG